MSEKNIYCQEIGEKTPVQQYPYKNGKIFLKREDLFRYPNSDQYGGKVRTCWALCKDAKKKGCKGIVTAGSRSSPQCNIVATIAQSMNIPCRIHTPRGELGPEIQSAKNRGAEIVQHFPGYNNVIVKRCRDDASESGWFEIPFGMECQEAVIQTMNQTTNLPWEEIKRIVVPVGSGMSLCGILYGIAGIDEEKRPEVIGVCVGSDPVKRLNKYAPDDWEKLCKLVKSDIPYHKSPEIQEICGVKLDPIYESKCVPFLREGDLLWIVGLRGN